MDDYYVVIRRADADVVIVDDRTIVRDVARVIARHLGVAIPAPRRAAPPPVVPLAAKPDGGER